jgi:hypothetical protein
MRGKRYSDEYRKRVIELTRKRVPDADAARILDGEFNAYGEYGIITSRTVFHVRERIRKTTRDDTLRLPGNKLAQDVTKRVKELVDKGMSAIKIADEIGRTKGSVIGICHRYGFKLHSRPGFTKHHGQTKEELSRARWDAWQKRNPTAIKFSKRKLALIEMTAGDAIMNPTDIWDLQWNQCRWPLWCDDATPQSEKRYCGAKSEDGCSYCAGHMQMATGARVRGDYRGRANKWTVTGGSWRAA